MPFPQFDRRRVKFLPLSARKNKQQIAKMAIDPDSTPTPLPGDGERQLDEVAERVKTARANGKPVMLVFGAHSIKNCLGPLFIRMMEEKWVTHLATNGAGIIHDWEFSFQGESSEDVRANVDRGQFGNWIETGTYLNLAFVVGAYRELGYGESVGRMVQEECLEFPAMKELREIIAEGAKAETISETVAAAADLLWTMQQFDIPEGRMNIAHPFKQYGVQAAAYRLQVPFTGHPMIGHDIIYNSPYNHGGALGRCAVRDFLIYAHSVEQLDGGVYLSIGSAVMSPMIFEKSLSISQNVHLQKGSKITNHLMVVVDLQVAPWDWSQGEPPMDNPAYYLRYCKTFNRMGGTLKYITADNRDFLLGLYSRLR